MVGNSALPTDRPSIARARTVEERGVCDYRPCAAYALIVTVEWCSGSRRRKRLRRDADRLCGALRRSGPALGTYAEWDAVPGNSRRVVPTIRRHIPGQVTVLATVAFLVSTKTTENRITTLAELYPLSSASRGTTSLR